MLRTEIERVRILRREHHRRGPGKAVLGMGFAEVANCVGSDDLCLAGAAIVAEELSVRSSSVDGVGIGGVRSDVAALARAGGVPIAESNRSIITAAQDVNATAILLR